MMLVMTMPKHDAQRARPMFTHNTSLGARRQAYATRVRALPEPGPDRLSVTHQRYLQPSGTRNASSASHLPRCPRRRIARSLCPHCPAKRPGQSHCTSGSALASARLTLLRPTIAGASPALSRGAEASSRAEASSLAKASSDDEASSRAGASSRSAGTPFRSCCCYKTISACAAGATG